MRIGTFTILINDFVSLNSKLEGKSVVLLAITGTGDVKLTRFGNLVVGTFYWTGELDGETVIFNVPNEFRPTIEYRVRPVQEKRSDIESYLSVKPNGNLSICSWFKGSDFFEATLVWHI